jgi:hypothetical protein
VEVTTQKAATEEKRIPLVSNTMFVSYKHCGAVASVLIWIVDNDYPNWVSLDPNCTKSKRDRGGLGGRGGLRKETPR